MLFEQLNKVNNRKSVQDKTPAENDKFASLLKPERECECMTVSWKYDICWLLKIVESS